MTAYDKNAKYSLQPQSSLVLYLCAFPSPPSFDPLTLTTG